MILANAPMDGLTKRSFYAPSIGQTLMDRFWRQSKCTTPLRDRLGFPSKSQPPIVAPIVVLFGICGPATILRGITRVIVDSLQRHIRRSFAHVREEIWEDEPAVTNRDTAPSIARVSRVGWLQTSGPHAPPYHQYRVWSAAFGAAVERFWDATVGFRHSRPIIEETGE